MTGVLRDQTARGPAGPTAPHVDDHAATRYMCAAAHLEPGFADRVVEQVLEEEHRALAPCYGVDLVPVVVHALRARRRQRWRDAGLASLAVLLVVTAVLVPQRALHLALLGVELAWLLVLLESTVAYFDVVARRLLRGRYDTRRDAGEAVPHGRRLAELEQGQRGNVVVYSGYSPFVGSGSQMHAWSFTLDLHKGREDTGGRRCPQEFELSELYERVQQAVTGLGLPCADVRSLLFANGRDVAQVPEVLPDPYARPVTSVDDGVLRAHRDHASPVLRHYQCIRVEGWDGELVLSVFLRFTRVERSLFAEASYFCLPPFKEELHVIDGLTGRPTFTTLRRLALRALLRTPLLWLTCFGRLRADLLRPLTRPREQRRARRVIADDAAFDYGAGPSLREQVTGSVFRRYFQQLDREMYVKVVESALFDTLLEFFDEHDLDTSDLRERQSVVQNNGVIVSSGGSFTADNVAVGSQARAVRVPRPRTAPGPSTPN